MDLDLETRALAGTIGRIIGDVRGVLDRTRASRFEVGFGLPKPGAYPHAMTLTGPIDSTSAALVAEEVNKAYGFDPRHVRCVAPRSGLEPQSAVYLAWDGESFPGRAPRSRA
jgi:hypothetical protein